eukprot:457261-Pelagomonas_calceolata.AAC.4
MLAHSHALCSFALGLALADASATACALLVAGPLLVAHLGPPHTSTACRPSTSLAHHTSWCSPASLCPLHHHRLQLSRRPSRTACALIQLKHSHLGHTVGRACSMAAGSSL